MPATGTASGLRAETAAAVPAAAPAATAALATGVGPPAATTGLAVGKLGLTLIRAVSLGGGVLTACVPVLSLLFAAEVITVVTGFSGAPGAGGVTAPRATGDAGRTAPGVTGITGLTAPGVTGTTGVPAGLAVTAPGITGLTGGVTGAGAAAPGGRTGLTAGMDGVAGVAPAGRTALTGVGGGVVGEAPGSTGFTTGAAPAIDTTGLIVGGDPAGAETTGLTVGVGGGVAADAPGSTGRTTGGGAVGLTCFGKLSCGIDCVRRGGAMVTAPEPVTRGGVGGGEFGAGVLGKGVGGGVSRRAVSGLTGGGAMTPEDRGETAAGGGTRGVGGGVAGAGGGVAGVGGVGSIEAFGELISRATTMPASAPAAAVTAGARRWLEVTGGTRVIDGGVLATGVGSRSTLPAKMMRLDRLARFAGSAGVGAEAGATGGSTASELGVA